MTMQSANAMGPEAEGPNAENLTRSAKCGSFPFSWVSCSVALAGGPARAHRSNGPSGAGPGRAMLVLFCLILTDSACLLAMHMMSFALRGRILARPHHAAGKPVER